MDHPEAALGDLVPGSTEPVGPRDLTRGWSAIIDSQHENIDMKKLAFIAASALLTIGSFQVAEACTKSQLVACQSSFSSCYARFGSSQLAYGINVYNACKKRCS